MLISFIVPIYNRETLIDGCLHSLLSNAWNDYEIILVDDASTDCSAVICDRYAAQYENIHVIHLPENHGPGFARNRGIEIAQGEWIFFLDSDDLICTENLSAIIPQIERMPASVELIAVDVIDEFNGIRWDYPYFEEMEILDVIMYIQKYPMRVHMPLWNYLFRCSYIKYQHLRLPDLYAHEDIPFLLDALRKTSAVGCIPGFFYCYRRGFSENSLASKHAKKYNIQSYEPYIAALCGDIATWTQASDRVRQTVYTQLLVKCSLDIVHVLVQQESPCRHALTVQPLQAERVKAVGVVQYLTDILFESLPLYEGKRVFFAPANKISRILADYLSLYSCQVVGMIDNYVPSVQTPLGQSIPVYPREQAHEVCKDIPILITNNWGVGAKLEKYFHAQGLTTLPWILKRDGETP